ncbi:hypothetical protein EVAR_49319_1 [Eumeta japonica]|uniref:THAP-type domain-containing protein n=1 Tax=Eumeta variegata TaxID=151549 RepID=A0A4C1Y864_EUMVA|nr:hypothetical protein EVAR_49319_1 [Eumeta japonica]
MSNLKSYRSCFEPLCTNTTKTTPENVLNVPQDEKRRKKWFQAVLRDNPKTKSNFFCCEDHFDTYLDALAPRTSVELNRSYDTKDGSSRVEEGNMLDAGTDKANLDVHGAVSWQDDRGHTYQMVYKAGTRGYRTIIKRIS